MALGRKLEVADKSWRSAWESIFLEDQAGALWTVVALRCEGVIRQTLVFWVVVFHCESENQKISMIRTTLKSENGPKRWRTRPKKSGLWGFQNSSRFWCSQCSTASRLFQVGDQDHTKLCKEGFPDQPILSCPKTDFSDHGQKVRTPETSWLQTFPASTNFENM